MKNYTSLEGKDVIKFLRTTKRVYLLYCKIDFMIRVRELRMTSLVKNVCITGQADSKTRNSIHQRTVHPLKAKCCRITEACFDASLSVIDCE